jgi:hypothetical protein
VDIGVLDPDRPTLQLILSDYGEGYIPVKDLPNGPGQILAGALVLLLLVGFRRLRQWAWLGIMAWCGFNLAVALYTYFAFNDGQNLPFRQLLFNSLIVLALNMEDVQVAFGLRRPATVPLRPDVPGRGVRS